MATPLVSGAGRLVAAHPHAWLGLMLLALHAALAWDPGHWWARAFLLVHFGLFLLWQPVWRGDRAIEPRHALMVVIVGLLLAVLSNWWLTAVWLAVLVALIGGSVPGITHRRRRLASILAALYLLSMLLIWVVPHLFANPVLSALQVMTVRYGLPFIPLAIILVRFGGDRSQEPIAVDLFYSMLLFLLVVVLVLGSFVVTEVSHGRYPLALAQTLLVTALLLVVLSWLWSPRSGFAGFGHFLSRYLMSLGLPFERWVQRLAELAQGESEPQRFLVSAMQHMLELPWISGAQWKGQSGTGECGTRSEHAAEFPGPDLQMTVFARGALSPAMLLHLKLLIQMVGHFHEAKRREQIQRQNAYTQAIHETGSRLTHDVKNLLQSLRALCAAAETSGAERAADLQLLMQRQLPQIARRLNETLDRLQAPQQADPTRVDALIWWQGFMQRHDADSIEFMLDGADSAGSIPAELFDSVADNLIENARRKETAGGGVRLRVAFSPAGGGALTICDSGAAISDDIAARLFAAPVASSLGLGVGLYHAARQADQLGYTLALTANERGRVCFTLDRPAPG